MATLAFSSAGSKLYICTTNAAPATFDAAGYAAQTYVEIKELTTIGVIGEEAALITHMPVGDPTTYKLKGNFNSGALALKGARATGDAGQAKLLVALQDPSAYSIKLVLANATAMYVQGQVMSYTTDVGSVNQITGFDTKIELSGKFITV